MKRPAIHDAALEDIAAHWLVRRQAGLSPDEAREFAAWLEGDPRHRAAFAEVTEAWQTLAFPGDVGAATAVRQRLARAAKARQRRRLVSLAGATAAVALCVMFWPGRSGPLAPQLPATVVARPHLEELPDGTRVEFNAGAEIATDFSGTHRAVRLVRGEALFAVTPDPARPFVVTAGDVRVRAVGTAFSVRQGPEGVDVLVTEGRVAVSRTTATAAAEPLLVDAGSRIAVPADPALTPQAAVPIPAEAVASALAWRNRRVEFTRTSVAEAALLFNRRNQVQLVVTDPALARLTLSGIFWADDPEGFVRLLESGFEVRSTRSGHTITLHSR